MKNPIIFTEESKELTKIYVQARALFETIHPVVTKYQKEILSEINAQRRDNKKPITDPFWIFDADDATRAKYHKRCREEGAKNGLSYSTGCPLEEARKKHDMAKMELGKHLLSIIPGGEKLTIPQMLIFDRTNGKTNKDKFGRTITRLDLLVDTALKVLIPLTFSYK